MVFWKKGNERFALVIVAVVAVFGLFLMWQNAGDVTGFAAKKAAAKTPAAPAPETRTCVDSDGGRVLDVKGFVSGEYVNGQAYRFDDKCTSRGITEYTCKDPTKIGIAQTSCPRGSRCQDGACVSLCGNGRRDPAENCGTCLADAPCGADEVCQNNACASRFFCRDRAPWGTVETPDGMLGPRCDPATSVTTRFNCGGYNATHQVNSSQQQCGGWGCNVNSTSCCDRPGRSVFVCDPSGARVNQTTSVCDGQVRSVLLPCSADRPVCTPAVRVNGNATCAACSTTLVRASCDGLTLINESRNTCSGEVQTERISCVVLPYGAPGNCVAAENYASCERCGERACFNLTNSWDPIKSGRWENCGGNQDLGIVQC